MIALVLALSPTERWTAGMLFLTALLGVVGLFGRMAWRVFRAVELQIVAIAANTRAAHELTTQLHALAEQLDGLDTRVERLERERGPRPVRGHV